MTTNIAILGASGYTGAELVRLALSHPYIHIKALAANRHAGKQMADLFPSFHGLSLPILQQIDDIDFSAIDVVFCCLPHAHSHKVVKQLPESVKVVDLSADFRLHDIAVYEEWYGSHAAPELQDGAVYGLTEWFSKEIARARLVACPGCYPTASLLPLWPIVGFLEDNIIIDAKSGVSGAGRTAKENLLAAEVQEGISAYGIAAHRHTPEIQQGIQLAGGQQSITFTPHLMPMNRGILATIYAQLKDGFTYQVARENLVNAYKNHPFVQVLPEGNAPHTRAVRGSNRCQLNIFQGRQPQQIILVSVIDNLIKGASGQAIQNMNLMQGYNIETGLPLAGFMP